MKKATDDQIIAAAIGILERRLHESDEVVSNAADVVNLLKLKLSDLEHEIFGVILMDTHGRFVRNEVLFRGTLIHTTVYPREVVKLALEHNASKMILYHNHPGGSLKPTKSDRTMTTTLEQILNVIDVKVLDHIIISGNKYFSFQEHALMKD